MSRKNLPPKLDFSSSQDSLDEIPDISSAPSEPSSSGKVGRRPRPKPINLGQLGILKKDSTSSSTPPDTLPSSSTAPSSSSSSHQPDSSSDIISQNYKLNIRDEDLQSLEELGTGAGGSVYRVIHRQTNTIMAKKIIHQLDSKLSNELLKELQILNKCHSTDIVSLYGAYQHNNQICICMEYMDVGSLEKISKIAGKVGEGYLARISVAVIRGLSYMFEQHRIIHRDIKPSNILVNSMGKVKICDFGVSGELANTLANTFVGTGAYMSPERIQGTKYSVQCDCWSLGLTLLELALGRFPFHSPGQDDETAPFQLSVFELLQHIVGEPLPTLPEKEYSEIFRNFVSVCLTKDPQQRPTPTWLLKNHPIVRHAEQLNVNMESWARSFLEPNLNPKQMQRWSITQKAKRQSWLNAMERRRSGLSMMNNGMAGLALKEDLESIPWSPPTSRKK